MKKITIVTGHYGSGKTNFSANLAVSLAKTGEKVTVVDLDIVNPYFRSADFSELFSKYGITLTASMYANSNLDIPALSFELDFVVKQEGYIIIDVGGDDAGATALGRYASSFEKYSDQIDMLYVFSKYRYLTSKPEEAYEFLREIEATAKMKHTGLVNNSNLGQETNLDTVKESLGYAEELSKLSALQIKYTCIPQGENLDTENSFETEVFVKKLWDE